MINVSIPFVDEFDVDYSSIGTAVTFNFPAPQIKVEKLKVDDVVLLCGDSVDCCFARVDGVGVSDVTVTLFF